MEKLPSIIHKSWYPYLKEAFKNEHMEYLNHMLLPYINYYPATENIFRVFSMPLEEVRVVFIGQDPYPDKGQAIGYAFAVAENVPKPFSLRAIEKELGFEIDRTLSHWVKQGVFLLNASLTVEHKKPNSHSIYWAEFTQTVIKTLASNVNPIWVLWGQSAQRYIKVIENNSISPSILKAAHPAAESYSKNAGFYGCKHFTKVNLLLTQNKRQIINW